MKFNSNKFLLSLILPQIFGAIGSIFTFSSIRTWYFTLIKPSFNPPGWIFGPVWAILFILMGIAFYFIWMNNSKYKKLAIIFYFIQLILICYGVYFSLNYIVHYLLL
jgi:tryptophan-rich sensory protein